MIKKIEIKKYLKIGIFIGFCFILIAFIRSTAAQEIVLNYTFPDPEINEVNISNNISYTITMQGLYTIDNPNLPLLPIKPLKILLPQKGLLESINVSYSGNISLGNGFNVTTGGYVYGNDTLEYYNISNKSYYNFSVPYPTNLYSIIGICNFRGYSILVFNLYPIHYIKDSGEIYYYKNMTVTINTNESGPISPLFRGLENDQMMMRCFVNDFSMESTYNSYAVHSHSSIVNPTESYKYVIITTDGLKNADSPIGYRDWYTFQDLADYKNAHGISTTIVTVSQIKNDPYYWGNSESSLDNCNDTQSQIRNFIRDAYENWKTEYVLLGGDHKDPLLNDVVPSRYLKFVATDNLYNFVTDCPSDLYYSCISGPFNSNLNNVWGENTDGENGGDVNFDYSVSVGRACVDTPREVNNFVSKTLTYEKTKDNDPYLQRVLLAGENLCHNIGEQHPEDVWTWGDDYKDQVIDNCDIEYPTYGIPTIKYTSVDKLYDRNYWDGSYDHWYKSEGWNKFDLLNRLNEEKHIVNGCGHGYDQTGQAMRLNFTDTLRLTNNKPFFLFTQACWAGNFDNQYIYTKNMGEMYWQTKWDSFAEYMNVKTRHGAFAVIAGSRTCFNFFSPKPIIIAQGPAEICDRQFFNAMYGTSGCTELGNALIFSKVFCLNYDNGVYQFNRDQVYETNLFGDPQLSLKIPVNNNPPVKPSTPQGNCIIGKFWEYSTSATDPEGDSVYYNWAWDDQTNSNWDGPYESGQTVTTTHWWPNSGTHKITVRAKDQFGYISDWSEYCWSTVSFDLSMQINPNPLVINHQANFYGQAECGEQWVWDFGQGRGKQYQQNATQTYTAPGEYTVNLTVTNEQNITCTVSGSVKVVLLKSDFIASSIYSTPHEIIIFNDTSEGYYTIGNWSWDFGDGYKAYTRNTSHDYTTEGKYEVSLAVRDSSYTGNTSRKIIYVDTTSPKITMVSARPQNVGFGSNLSITAHIYDNVSGVKIASINITCPDSSRGNFTMNTSDNNTYEYTFNHTRKIGTYSYTIWTEDNANNSKSSAGHVFSVSRYFGYNIVGCSNQSILDTITGSVFMVHEKGVADNITVYLDPGNATADSHYQCLIYRHNDSTLIGTTEERNVSSGKGWRTFSFSSPKPLLCNETEYVITCWGDNQNIKMYYDNSSGSEQGHYFEGVYNYTPDPISFTHEDRKYSIYCDYTQDYTPPKISNISTTPHSVGFGFNVTLSANVTDTVSGVNIVSVNITYPDHTHGNYSMTNTTATTYYHVFNVTWLNGQYNFTIWTSDRSNNSNSSSGHHFHVSANATIGISTLKDSYSGTQYINLTDPPNQPQNLTVIDRGLTWNNYYNVTSGCNEFEVSTGPINYQEDNGTWTPINNSFRQLTSNDPAYNYGYRTGNDHGLFGVYFKPNAQNNWPVAFTYNKSDDPTAYVIRSKLVGVGYLDPASNWSYQYLQNVQSSQGQTNGNSVTYPGVFTGTDVTWSYGNTELKEAIIMSNATKTALQNHPPSQYGLHDASSYLVFITKLDYQNLNMYNASGMLTGNVTITDKGVDFKDALGYFKCALPLGDAYRLNNESVRQKLRYRIVHLNGDTYLLSGLKVSDLIAMTFPVVIDPTLSVNSITNDGYIYNRNTNYNTAWAASTGTISSTATYISIGQDKVATIPSNYDVYRGFLFFNTSSLPSNAIIDNAKLSLYKKDDYSTKDFTITIQNGQPTYPHNPLQTGDYAKSHYVGNGGGLNTSRFVNGQNFIGLTNLNWINRTGMTKLCLRSSRDINGTMPTVNEYVNVYSADALGGYVPNLFITYRNQSKIKDTGSTNIKGYLLIQVQFYNASQGKWILDNNTVNETSPRTINSGSQLGLDTIFNGKIRASNLKHGAGTYRVYTAFRSPTGVILKTNSGVELKAWWQFSKT